VCFGFFSRAPQNSKGVRMALFKQFDLDWVRQSKPSILREVDIDLSTARTDEVLHISGDFFHVVEQTGKLKIR
jgi:hypothetical protein